LRAIQSITDAALSRLDDGELPAELLERTRDALQADTAAVLLLDFSSGQLIATAATGLEEEPTGELCVVIGDVAGSGLPAAVIMGRMRSALRAYALETRDPAEVLDRLDRKMQHFEADAMATVAVYGHRPRAEPDAHLPSVRPPRRLAAAPSCTHPGPFH
jgi:hypothetical protein